jgi:hypothetical protein
MVQPTYPAGQGGPYQAAPPAAPVPTPGRTGAIAAALCVLLAGVIGGIVMLLLSGSRRDAAIDGLARAPIGCTTTLDFAKAGDFVVFVETRGSIGAVRGDCPNANRSYDYQGQVPDVEVDLVDLDGAALVLTADRSISYDGSGSIGTSLGRFEIEQAGEYLLTATSDVSDVVVTIGKDPDDAASMLTVGGYVAMAAGLLVGGVMLAVALRRPRAGAQGTGAGQQYVPVQQVPVAPPYQSPAYQSPVSQSGPPTTGLPPRAVPGTFAPPTQVQPTQPPPEIWPEPPAR